MYPTHVSSGETNRTRYRSEGAHARCMKRFELRPQLGVSPDGEHTADESCKATAAKTTLRIGDDWMRSPSGRNAKAEDGIVVRLTSTKGYHNNADMPGDDLIRIQHEEGLPSHVPVFRCHCGSFTRDHGARRRQPHAPVGLRAVSSTTREGVWGNWGTSIVHRDTQSRPDTRRLSGDDVNK